jgi:hypothetical protein
MRDRIGAERGWPPMQRADFEREAEHGALHVGSPETVARRIAATAKALGVARFDMKYSAGTRAGGDTRDAAGLIFGARKMRLARPSRVGRSEEIGARSRGSEGKLIRALF